MVPQWSPRYYKSCPNTMISIKTYAVCTSYIEILCVRNPENLQSSWRVISFSVLIWWRWQHSSILSLQRGISLFYHNNFMLNTWTLQPEWVHHYHLLLRDNHMMPTLKGVCNTGDPCHLRLWYPFPCVYSGKLYIRIPCSSKDHFSILWIYQKKTVTGRSACAL
jgi:hypothetical protein